VRLRDIMAQVGNAETVRAPQMTQPASQADG
jgi:hypothetical protein